MIKRDYGWVKINNTKSYIVPKLSKKAVKDLCIGLGLIALGVKHISANMFHHGAIAYEEAEYRALNAIGAFDHRDDGTYAFKTEK